MCRIKFDASYEEFVKLARNEALEPSKLAAASKIPPALFALSSLSVAELAKARGQLGQAVRAGSPGRQTLVTESADWSVAGLVTGIALFKFYSLVLL